MAQVIVSNSWVGSNPDIPVKVTSDSGALVQHVNVDAMPAISIAGVATEAKQDTQITLATALNAKDFATETTLASLDSKVTACDTSAVVVSSSALPSGAATEATLSALEARVVMCDTQSVVVTASDLPAGAATQATLSTLNGKVTACNTGAVVLATGDNTYGRAKITDGTLVASIRDTGSNDSLNVAIVDASGNQITSFGGAASAISLASSDNTAITSATNTTLIAAVPGQKHRIKYIQASNSGATTTDVMWRDGASGARCYRTTLPENGVFAHALQSGYWELSTNTALVMTTTAAGNVHWSVEYETV